MVAAPSCCLFCTQAVSHHIFTSDFISISHPRTKDREQLESLSKRYRVYKFDAEMFINQYGPNKFGCWSLGKEEA